MIPSKNTYLKERQYMPTPHSSTIRNIRKKKKATQSSDTPDFFDLSKKAIAGGSASLCTSVLLSLISAALCLLSPDPATLTLPIGITIFFVSAVVGGAISAIGLKGKSLAAMTSAAFSGFILVIATGICAAWQAAAAPYASHNIAIILSLLIRCSAIPTSAAVGYLMSKKAKNHRRKRR